MLRRLVALAFTLLALAASAPDDTVATTVKAEFNACQHGRVEVGPVQQGDGAKPQG